MPLFDTNPKLDIAQTLQDLQIQIENQYASIKLLQNEKIRKDVSDFNHAKLQYLLSSNDVAIALENYNGIKNEIQEIGRIITDIQLDINTINKAVDRILAVKTGILALANLAQVDKIIEPIANIGFSFINAHSNLTKKAMVAHIKECKKALSTMQQELPAIKYAIDIKDKQVQDLEMHIDRLRNEVELDFKNNEDTVYNYTQNLMNDSSYLKHKQFIENKIKNMKVISFNTSEGLKQPYQKGYDPKELAMEMIKENNQVHLVSQNFQSSDEI